MYCENVTVHAIRLRPGQDLRKEIERYIEAQNIQAGWLATCVGSLTQTHIRFAGQSAGNFATGYFEIVSLVGTVSINGCHLHLSVSDRVGQTTGGHLLYENLVYTTAEIIIGAGSDLRFTRKADADTGWKELNIEKVEGANHNRLLP